MILYRGFEFLLLDPDIALCHGGAAVLQELLHQGDVIAVGFVDLGGEELPKAVGADALEAEEVADQLQVLLNLALGEREKRLVLPDAVVLAVDPDPLIQGEWNGGKLGLEDGLILPTGMMTNRNPKSEHFNQDQKLDSWHLLSGTITNTEDFGEEKPSYAVGSRCLILYDKESDDAVALCFIVTDDDGRIRKIHTTSDSRYRFTPDSPPELNMPGEE